MPARALRLVVMMIRPPVAAVVMLFAALGVARAAPPVELQPLFTTVLLIIAGWFVNATVLNDLADEAIDRVNLVRARGRPLVSGHASRGELLTVGLIAAAVSLGTALTVRPALAAVVAGGLVLNAAYSLRPMRLCSRGVVASAVLPAGYVVVPYLVGAFSLRATVGWHELALLPGLYIAFVGRILLKDFRDVAGDAAFGKWTFLLRHGRQVTCRVSALCWMTGGVLLLAAIPASVAVVVATAIFIGCALHGLHRLERGGDPVADQVTIGAIAQAGRASCITVLAHLTMLDHAWTAAAQTAVIAMLALVFVGSYAATLSEEEPEWAIRPC